MEESKFFASAVVAGDSSSRRFYDSLGFSSYVYLFVGTSFFYNASLVVHMTYEEWLFGSKLSSSGHIFFHREFL